MNTGKTGGSETSKKLDKSRLLSPSIKLTEDCRPQLSNVKERSPVPAEMAAPSVKAAVSERSPVIPTADVNDTMICDQRVVTDEVCVIDSTDAQKELSTVSLQKPAGTVLPTFYRPLKENLTDCITCIQRLSHDPRLRLLLSW